MTLSDISIKNPVFAWMLMIGVLLTIGLITAFMVFTQGLIITDMNMPGLNGIDLAKKVKAQDSTKPIILCSGFTTENDIQQAMEAGINSVLKKPTETIDLLKNIRKIFNQQSKSVQ